MSGLATTALLIGNGISILILLAMIGALIYTARSYRIRAWSEDYSSYLDIMTRFSVAWRRFRDAEEQERPYELSELFSLIEVGCLLCRCGTIKGAPKEFLEDDLSGYIRKTCENDYARNHLIKVITEERTLIQMELFAKEHGIENFPELDSIREQIKRLPK